MCEISDFFSLFFVKSNGFLFVFSQEFTEYENFDECLAYIEECMIKNGPFDGLLGFSQVCLIHLQLLSACVCVFNFTFILVYFSDQVFISISGFLCLK